VGDPKKPRKKYETPGHPWLKARIERELELVYTYGLRNKRELWIAETMLRKIRHRARSLLELPVEQRKKELEILGRRLFRMGLVDKENIDINDILSLTVESILERRLQTIVWRKGLAKTVYHARQLVVHGHIAIKGRRITSPGYLVSREEEQYIDYHSASPYAKQKIQTSSPQS
jgi:small subunit ribosomal protein S4